MYKEHKVKIFKNKTTRYQRINNRVFIPKILRMYFDDFYMSYGHLNKANKDKLNKRIKFYWAHWGQLRNTNYSHNFKNHFVEVPTKEKIEKELKEIEIKINNYANKGLYSVNCYEVKYLYQRKRELQRLPQYKDIDYSEKFINGSDVPINGYYE